LHPKIIRADYNELIYTALARKAIDEWRKPPWAPYYHESGLLSFAPADSSGSYVQKSIERQIEFYGSQPANLQVFDKPDAIRAAARTKAPPGDFEGMVASLNTASGWAWARGAMDKMAALVREAGVQVVQGEVTALVINDGDVKGVKTKEGDVLGDLTILAAGGWSASLVPELEHLLLANGQAVATLQLSADEAEVYADMPVRIDLEIRRSFFFH
jgi:sarcosine oxidase/L-pipecolate oxidase